MRKKVATAVLVILIASAATVGCGRTIQRVAGTINGVVQTEEFATAADNVSDALWEFATGLADAVCDFCKDAFGGGSGNQETENPDAGETSDFGEAGTGNAEISETGNAEPSTEAGDAKEEAK